MAPSAQRGGSGWKRLAGPATTFGSVGACCARAHRTSVELFATQATSGPSGSLRRDVARSVMPAHQEPRVDAEPHGGLPTVGGPDRFRAQPPALFNRNLGAMARPARRAGHDAVNDAVVT